VSERAELKENLLAARLEGVLTWVIERRIQFLISIGVLVAVLLISSVFVLRKREQVDQARTKLAYAQSLVSQRAYAEAAPIIDEVRKANADSDTARLAAYLAGVSAFEQNKLDEAISLLTEAVDRSGGHALRPLARMALGTALEQKKDFPAAVANYGAFLAEMPDHFLSPRVQLSLGRAHLLAGNEAEARKALEHLIDQLPTSEWAENARRLLDFKKVR
jgi:predicted negative regulator of RcsB-dependent stress response